MRLVLFSLLMISMVGACGGDEEKADERFEGSEAGDCSDEADNDRDGLFDCDDDGCVGSPACEEGDADADADTDGDADADVDGDADADEDTAIDGDSGLGDSGSAPIDGDGDGFDSDVDCDDGDAAIHPDAVEVCDLIDNDCDGLVDDEDDTLDTSTATTWYEDDDADGFGDLMESSVSCVAPEGAVAEDPAGFDCDDRDPAYHPGASEDDCTDPEDYNCDGSVAYADADDDGWPACEDCNDADAAIHPDANEVCDGIDNDCDDAVDDADDSLDSRSASTWYADADGDGFGDEGDTVLACEAPDGRVEASAAGFDCMDSSPAHYPGAPESDCTDPEDYNCDGSVAYEDRDGDGWAACAECDDTNSTVNPDAVEVCDGIDNDCDGSADDADIVLDMSTTTIWYADADGDTYGDPGVALMACEAPADMVDNADDCDDDDASLSPETMWYLDYDGDGYGSAAFTVTRCEAAAGWVRSDDDCDDGAPSINPGAMEVCDPTETDEDCDGLADDADPDGAMGSVVVFPDTDGDGYGSASEPSATYCSPPTGWVEDNTDCEDGDVSISPGADEVCDDADTDEDCDGASDDADAEGALGKVTLYPDADDDGYGSSTVPGEGYCDPPDGWLADSSDCADDRADISPDAAEICGDTEDNDCNGEVDETCGPSGERAPFNTMSSEETTPYCYGGNVCSRDTYSWLGTGQDFSDYGQAVTCTGESTLVANVGITTYDSAGACQGGWNIFCDGDYVGIINTVGRACAGSAMTNGCDVSFSPRMCSEIRIESVFVYEESRGCCGSSGPDSMITAVSAW